jgi:hypothetical protein
MSMIAVMEAPHPMGYIPRGFYAEAWRDKRVLRRSRSWNFLSWRQIFLRRHSAGRVSPRPFGGCSQRKFDDRLSNAGIPLNLLAVS